MELKLGRAWDDVNVLPCIIKSILEYSQMYTELGPRIFHEHQSIVIQPGLANDGIYHLFAGLQAGKGSSVVTGHSPVFLLGHRLCIPGECTAMYPCPSCSCV